MYTISQLKYEDIAQALRITSACAISMQEKGIFQWNEDYPNREILEKDVENKELFGCWDNKQLVGIVVLTPKMDEEYKEIDWLSRSDNNLYIHRLAVDPLFQNQGIASFIMDFAEKFAIQNNFLSVRLDTFSQNPKNNYFYSKRNYKRLGEVYFHKQSTHPFYCYELVINV